MNLPKFIDKIIRGDKNLITKLTLVDEQIQVIKSNIHCINNNLKTLIKMLDITKDIQIKKWVAKLQIPDEKLETEKYIILQRLIFKRAGNSVGLCALDYGSCDNFIIE